MKKRDYVIIGGIMTLALIAIFSHIYFFSAFNEESDRSSDRLGAYSVYVGRAKSLLATGTFNYGGPGYFGNSDHGPGYPTAIALAFFLFGERQAAITILNSVFFAGAVFFLWLLGRFFFAGGLEFVPPLLLAMFWGAFTRTALPNYELFSLFLIILFLFSLFHYRGKHHFLWLAVGACAFAILVLERPILLYFFPIPLFFLIIWHSGQWKEALVAFMIFLMIAGSIIGTWSLRNKFVLDTWQLGTGGTVIIRKASQLDFTYPEIFSMMASFSMGNLIGSKIISFYPPDGKPKTWDPAIDKRLEQAGWLKPKEWIMTDIDGEALTRVGLDQKMMREAVAKIKQGDPFKFFLTGVANLFRLNAPTNYGGQEMMDLFFKTRDNLSTPAKIGIILLIRGAWFVFLCVVFFGIFFHMKDWRTWGLPALCIIYINSMYAFLTHAEVRYILIAMPFYFFFFAEGLRLLFFKFWFIRKTYSYANSSRETAHHLPRYSGGNGGT